MLLRGNVQGARAPDAGSRQRSRKHVVRDGRLPGTLSDRFEQAVIRLLTALIAIGVVAALRNLGTEVFVAPVLVGALDSTAHMVFQSVFGVIVAVIVALEFERSIPVATERCRDIVRAKTVALLAMLAPRVVFRVVREQDRRELKRDAAHSAT